jgi:alginate O-acetyltransferase complex protein AlgI
LVFSSQIFLFVFLPLVLASYALVGARAKNSLLLVASLLFYAWGEGTYLLLMVVSITLNHFLGLRLRSADQTRQLSLVLGVASNLLLLGVFKYAGWLVESVNRLLSVFSLDAIAVPNLPLPIGVSFFTFQAISYLVDIYRGDAEAQRKWRDTALYISLFPQLIAGPIVRYQQIADDLKSRSVGTRDWIEGIDRFVIGLGKKILIADTLSVPADIVFSLDPSRMEPAVAWSGVLFFSLQIYFDFSGYSDMAIGLGRMFGFHFPENFRHPYSALSIRDFWRRWHITLSTWFRDYLYIPLGGSRGSRWTTARNLVVVFFLCGLWHGASWTFVAWGLYHGLFLVLERTPFGKALDGLPRVLRSIYTLLIVAVGWVLFRADDPDTALAVIRGMFFVPAQQLAPLGPAALWLPDVCIAAVVGALLSWPLAGRWFSRTESAGPRGALHLATITLILVLCWMQVASSTHSPFLYFRF